MSAWEQVDAFRSARDVKAAGPSGEWRAFARLASGSLRFRGRVGDRRVKIERPCGFHPGKWRSNGFAIALDLPAFVVAAIAAAEFSGKWYGGFSPAQAEAVLVAYDAWLEAGAKRMPRPLAIP